MYPIRLWSDEIQAKVAGQLSAESVDYVATAKLVVTEGGWYTIDLPESGTQFRLNGVLLSGGNVALSEGVYDVELYTNFWGQPYLQFASAEVRRKGADERIPLVNTADDIKAFLGQRIDDRRVVEVSGYKPQPADLNIRAPKGKVLTPPADASD